MYVVRAAFQLPNNGSLYLLLSHQAKAQLRDQAALQVAAPGDLPLLSVSADSFQQIKCTLAEELCTRGPGFWHV